jgi:CRP/FNR family transcriptional regulator, cyclic AMP receptor protein
MINKLHHQNDGSSQAESLLYGISLFRGLELKELTSLFEEIEMRTYPPKSIVFMPEDSPGEKLYILRKGRVDLYRLTADGKRLVTRQMLPDEIFGMRGLLGQTTQKNFAETIEESTICILTREQIMEVLKRHPDLILRILEIVYRRLHLLEERLVETAYNPVNVRLAYFLLANADSATGMLSHITHEEIGDTIGALRQTVTETLGLMRKKGLITINPRKIQIIDRHGIEEIIQRTKTSY